MKNLIGFALAAAVGYIAGEFLMETSIRTRIAYHLSSTVRQKRQEEIEDIQIWREDWPKNHPEWYPSYGDSSEPIPIRRASSD